MLRAPMSGKPGIRPVPWRMIAAISSRERRSAMPSSDGIEALPFFDSPWQVAQLRL